MRDSPLIGRIERDGWVRVPAAVDASQLAAVSKWLADNTKSALQLVRMQVEREPSGAVRKVRRLLWADPDFWSSWIVASGLSTLVADVIGQEAQLLKHSAFLKSPGAEPVGFHQDGALWGETVPGALSFWVPLESAGPDNGGLLMATGSHVNGLIRHTESGDHPWHPVVDVDAVGLAIDSVSAEPGDVVIHSPFIVHGSGLNSSSGSRQATVFTFFPPLPSEGARPLLESPVSLEEIQAEVRGDRRPENARPLSRQKGRLDGARSLRRAAYLTRPTP